MKRKPIVVGNWKMFGTQRSIAGLLGGLLDSLEDEQGVELVVCPPALYLPLCQSTLAATEISWGAQNLCAYDGENGAYTGEISAAMLADLACTYVIVGHSERREYQCETDELIAEKFILAQSQGMQPILCVGESLQQREAGETLAFIASQIEAVVAKSGIEAFNEALIAYEPIWAIGTGLSATPEQAQEVHASIREQIAKHSAEIADKLRILYGGSVKPDNAAQLFANPDIDGALVGGASLKAKDFTVISKAAVE
jgi:triosephosphate isomerase